MDGEQGEIQDRHSSIHVTLQMVFNFISNKWNSPKTGKDLQEKNVF